MVLEPWQNTILVEQVLARQLVHKIGFAKLLDADLAVLDFNDVAALYCAKVRHEPLTGRGALRTVSLIHEVIE